MFKDLAQDNGERHSKPQRARLWSTSAIPRKHKGANGNLCTIVLRNATRNLQLEKFLDNSKYLKRNLENFSVLNFILNSFFLGPSRYVIYLNF